MMSQRLLGVLAVVTLLLPASVQSLIAENQFTTQTMTQTQSGPETSTLVSDFVQYVEASFSKLENKEPEQSVTPAVSEQSAPAPAPEAENSADVEEWQANLPLIEDDSPQAQFVNTIAPAAIVIANEHGIYPSVMIAQAALESSWGRSDLAQTYNNLMGTKGSWEGESVSVRTREDINGESVYINAGFSVYDSWTDSLRRYGQLMANGIASNPAIYKGTWRENAADYTEATAWLQGRYATDSSYASKLNQTIQSFNLDQFDEIDVLENDLDKTLAELTIENETNL